MSDLVHLYEHHHRWLSRWLLRRLHCPQDAADLAQDTFLRLLHAPQQESVSEPRAFLATVARRLLSNLYRRRALEHAYLESLAQLPEPLQPSPEDIALVREALSQIEQLLEGLPDRARHALLLHRLEGLKQAQIAQRLGVSLATVERDLRHAFLHCLGVASS
ncbi:sigma-70 family RNA polymerase sigma factor [Pseudomonas putida]